MKSRVEDPKPHLTQLEGYDRDKHMYQERLV